MRDGLYHSDIYLPAEILTPWLGLRWRILYGTHAARAALDDRYGRLRALPTDLQIEPWMVFEAEVEDGELIKVCVRIGEGFTVEGSEGPVDLSLVLSSSRTANGSLFVRTLWLNQRNDKHHTLDASKYVPREFSQAPKRKVRG